MGDRFRRWMYGRYGVDKLSRTLIYVALAFCILSMFFRGGFFYFISIAIMVYSYYRIFSKKLQKRYAELQKYEKFKSNISMRKTHHIYKCPNCKQKIRIPRGKGKIEVSCPKCRTSFIKNS